MEEDEEGFLYPAVDKARCIDCGACKKVCPGINGGKSHRPLKVYAAKNPNEKVRKESSSGGIFSLLAERTIAHGGVVFGARFNERWEVEHGYTETAEGIAAFRGSKYVQSRIGESYKQAETFLKQGRKVLFSGTPCQVAGLRRFLRKDYENLLLVDFVCHGVPSPGVFRQYLNELKAGFAREGKEFDFSSFSKFPLAERSCTHGDDDVRVEAISFRDKRLGWKKFSFAITLSKVSSAGEKETISRSHCFLEDDFMQAFLFNLILRPSCYECPFKGGRSESDITLGDFWGINQQEPNIDDDLGMSLVMAQSVKGKQAIGGCKLLKYSTKYDKVVDSNPNVEESVSAPPSRAFFFHLFNKEGFCQAFKRTTSVNFWDRAFRLIYRFKWNITTYKTAPHR